MIRWFAILLLWPIAVWADNPRSNMREGRRAFEEERFAEAAEAFRAAAETVQQSDRLDPARAWYNQANALFEAGQFAEAAAAYQEALGAMDLDVQQAAHFNRGNALLMNALDLANAQQLDQAARLSRQAVDSYRNALLLNPQDRAAKVNLEVADQVRQQIEELLEQMPPQPQESPQESPEESPEDEEGEDEQPSETPDAAPEPEAGEEDDAGEEPDQPAESAIPLGAEEEQEDSAESSPESMEEMSEEEAMLLLDAMRDEEQQTRDRMRLPLGDPEEVEKDW